MTRRRKARVVLLVVLVSFTLSACPGQPPHPWVDCRRYPVYC